MQALEDDRHPIWEIMFFGTKIQRGIIGTWERHPWNGIHSCGVCDRILAEHPWITHLIKRRNQARAKLARAL